MSCLRSHLQVFLMTFECFCNLELLNSHSFVSCIFFASITDVFLVVLLNRMDTWQLALTNLLYTLHMNALTY